MAKAIFRDALYLISATGQNLDNQSLSHCI